ncbi:hypothetical protein Cci01nite_25850 [Catellatospora citrea]|uniref:Uncharacterized protein n=1 Tax=Catellatospora citrea TaxID=53366 RepID=A0A8J3K6B5_9ACTN|nr:hypothetical protein C8E86_4419 [Catellatospora citrea]GIF97491.1 hypothetical protein Cci01nite_25850 [Catellatospora citrea]
MDGTVTPVTDLPSPPAPVVVETPAPRHGIAWSLRHLVAVLGTVGVLLLRHWPVLFALVFAGFAARRGVTLVAVQASDLDGVFGFLVFALVPVAVMTALVLMLRVLSRSLPTTTPGGEPGQRFRTLAHVASVLLPFIVVYASYGYFEADRDSYLLEIIADENSKAEAVTNPSALVLDERLPFTLNTTLVVVSLAALLLRFLLGLRADRLWSWIGFVRAYLEVLSLTLVAVFVSGVSDKVLPFVEHRQAYQWALSGWHQVVAQLGPLEEPVRATGTWFSELFLSLDVVLVVPLAWLIVGAVVYGQSLGTPPLSPKAARRAVRAARRWAKLPAPVRRLGAASTANVRETMTPLAQSFRLLAHAGKVPMLMFCVLFLAVQTLPTWLWELERALIGAQDLNYVWRPLSGPLSIVNDAISMVLLLCLVAATVDRVLRVQAPLPVEPHVPGLVHGAEEDPHRGDVHPARRDEMGDGLVPA